MEMDTSTVKNIIKRYGTVLVPGLILYLLVVGKLVTIHKLASGNVEEDQETSL
jgi:hypothetical protein